MDTIVFCRRCGVMNSVERGFCRECRASLDPAASMSPGAPGPAAAPARVRVCPRCRRGNPEDAVVCFDCGGRFTGSAAQPVLPPAAAPVAPDPLACPACGTEMETGVVFLECSSFWEQVLAGGPMHPVVFRRDEARCNEKVVRPGEKVHAQRCPACNSVWIAPPPPRPDWG